MYGSTELMLTALDSWMILITHNYVSRQGPPCISAPAHCLAGASKMKLLYKCAAMIAVLTTPGSPAKNAQN